LNLNSEQAIGIFDSGIGGLTVADKIVRDFPNEDVIYFGDTAHLPYGDKSEERIKHYSSSISKFLIEKGCKLIIIACNTASSIAYKYLSETLGSEAMFVNVVDPAISGINRQENIHNIGIIGTQGTINSDIYARKLKEKNDEIEVHSLATPLLAPMIESGFFNNQISESIIETYLENQMLKGIDALVLACTHYPLIKKQIEQYYGVEVSVFDSTDFISKETKRLLIEQNLLNDRKRNNNHFYVSDFTESFEKTTRIFFKEEIHLEYCPLWKS